MKKKILIVLMIISLYCTGCNITINANSNIDENNKKSTDTVEKSNSDLIGKTFTRTYNIRHVDESNDYNYIYITIRQFQSEEIETVKVERKMFENISEGDFYEITFKIEEGEIEDNIKSIFKSTKIIDSKKTDKMGLEQINEEFLINEIR